jgi:glutamyl-tRNA synthetase
MRERATFVKDFVEKSPYFFQPPKEYDQEVAKKRWKHDTADHLKRLVKEFSQLIDPKKEDYEAALQRAAEAGNTKNSELIHPVRLAVSGMGVGPGLYDILFILGRDETIRRITSAIEKL